MPNLTITSEPDAPRADRAHIADSLDEYNMRVTGDRNYSAVNIMLRDDSGAVRGGLLADIWGGWMHIRFIWVDEALRGQGYGGQLVTAAEEEARAKGIRNAYLETFSFQARPFYEGMGYAVFGELQDFPPGQNYYFLRKAL